METVTAKWTAVIVAKGEKTRLYSSMSDVPADLRRELETAMQREDSATIVIADESGRRELIRAFRGESDLQSGLAKFARANSRLSFLERWPVRRVAALGVILSAAVLSILIALK